MDDITLKQAKLCDAPVLYKLLHQMACDLGKEHEFKGSSKALEAWGFSKTPAFESIIAWRGDVALGLVLYFYEFSTWRGANGIYVQDLYVDVAARGHGIAARLISAAIARAVNDRDAIYMRLAVHKENDLGLRYYEAAGFRPISVETMMILEGDAFTTKVKGV